MYQNKTRILTIVATVALGGCYSDNLDAQTGGSTSAAESTTESGESETSPGTSTGGTTTASTTSEGPGTGPATSGTVTSAETADESGTADAGSDESGADDDTTATSDTTGETDTAADVCPPTHQCVDEVPADWNGPVAFDEQPFAEAPTQCAGPYPNEAVVLTAGLAADAAECTCGCLAPTGQSCPPAILRHWDDTCSGSADDNHLVSIGDCTEISALGELGSYRAFPTALPTGGSCTTSLDESLPTPVWGERATACVGAALDPAGCDVGEVCAPNPPAGFPAPLCIYRDGDLPCPADTDYTERTVYFAGMDDTRDCIDDCECGGVADGDCGGYVEVYNQFGCSQATNQVPADQMTCVEQPNLFVRSAEYFPEPTGTCDPSGGTPTGDVAPSEPTTVCCSS